MEVLTGKNKDMEEVVQSEVGHKVAKSDEVPRQPEMSAMANKYNRLLGIHDKLVSQNKAIYKQEKILKAKEAELRNCKSLFKGKEKRGLQEQIDQLQIRIESMMKHIPKIVKEYGYANGRAFMREYQLAKAEYGDYVKAVRRWENNYGINEKPFNITEQLERNKEMIRAKERKHQIINKEKGAR